MKFLDCTGSTSKSQNVTQGGGAVRCSCWNYGSFSLPSRFLYHYIFITEFLFLNAYKDTVIHIETKKQSDHVEKTDCPLVAGTHYLL